ncbi:MAG: PDZ domain-containing protein [Fimbriimonadaceae bacterium]
MTLVALAAALALPSAGQKPVEVPFRIGEDALIVDATVNGKQASFMFDTGFSGSVVLNEAINIGKATGTMGLRDFVGTFTAKTVKITSLKLGDLAISSKDMEAVQQPLAHMTQSYNSHTDGIMGLQVIRDQVTEINFEKKRFIFHPKTLDITKRVPDNKKTFLMRMLPLGNNSIELEVVASTGKKLVLALDTGNAFFATTHTDVLERVGLWQAGKAPQFMKSAWVASGPVASWYKQMDDMKIFGVPVKKSYWSIIDLPSSSADGDGTVGFGFLRNFNIIFDFERRRVWLENWTGQVGNEMPAEVGIAAAHDEKIKRVRIYKVAPESPAAKAGIREGDQILAIDGQDLIAPTMRQVEKLLEGRLGSKVKLAISRQGNLIRYELERAQLVNP